VRWDELFDDLEAQFDAEADAQRSAEVSDRTRRETARLQLLDRLCGSVGTEVRVSVRGVGSLAGRLVDVGCDWLLLQGGSSGAALVPISAVLLVRGLRPDSTSADLRGPVVGRLDVRYALRALARDRSRVIVALIDGSRASGTVARVGADFVELAEHPVDEECRRGLVPSRATVAVAALAVVWRA
jgi:hypothetical protein